MSFESAKQYFIEFRNEKLEGYLEDMREYRVWPEGGYPNFYKDSEVVQCMVNIAMNLQETYDDLRIPRGFPSSKALIRSWKAFNVFLKDYDALFEEIREHLRTKSDGPQDGEPVVLTAVDNNRHQVIDALDAVLEMVSHEEPVKREPPKRPKKNPKWTLSREEGDRFDVAIITVLNSPEFLHLKTLISNVQIFNTNDPSKTRYYEGTLKKEHRAIKVLLACSNQMGMPVSAALATKIIYLYAPRVLAMCGISAGIKGAIGDILVPDIVWDYGSGKNYIEKVKDETGNEIEKERFAPYRYPEYVNRRMVGQLIEVSDDRKYLDDISSAYHGEKWKDFPTQLNAHVGPYASGSAVVANERILDHIKAQDGKLIGFDMEAFGVIYACNNCTSYTPLGLVVKSISDYGNSDKGNPNKDKYQDYAAFTSARYLVKLIENEIPLD